MDILETTQEDLQLNVDTVTIDVPLRITLHSDTESEFEFTSSIDELGQLVLIPSEGTIFTSASIEQEMPDVEQLTSITNTTDGVIKETVVLLKLTMLVEVTDLTVNVTVDDQGRCIVYPVAVQNNILSGVIDDSLNLITEDIAVVDYCGFTLRNTGDGWDVIDASSEVIEEGIATLNQAKLFVCERELRRLRGLEEEVDSIDTEKISATVIDEAIEFEQTTKALLRDLTEQFTEPTGAFRCDSVEEQKLCEAILGEYYQNIVCEEVDTKYHVTYSSLKSPLVEELEATDDTLSNSTVG